MDLQLFHAVRKNKASDIAWLHIEHIELLLMSNAQNIAKKEGNTRANSFKNIYFQRQHCGTHLFHLTAQTFALVSLYTVPMFFLWVSFGFCGFLPLSKNIPVSISKLVN